MYISVSYLFILLLQNHETHVHPSYIHGYTTAKNKMIVVAAHKKAESNRFQVAKEWFCNLDMPRQHLDHEDIE